MTNWKEKQKEWHEKYDDMFQEFPATESEADRKERSRKLSGGSGIILQKSGRAQEEIP